MFLPTVPLLSRRLCEARCCVPPPRAQVWWYRAQGETDPLAVKLEPEGTDSHKTFQP